MGSLRSTLESTAFEITVMAPSGDTSDAGAMPYARKLPISPTNMQKIATHHAFSLV